MNKEELKITQQDKLLLQEMRENCLKADVYDDEKRLLKANAITKFLYLPQENQQLKEELKYTVPIVEHNKIVSEKNKENQQLKEKINTYENPEDLTLMFMYCDEKAKDKIKQLKEVIEEVRKHIEIQKKKPYKSLSAKATICNKYNEVLQILDKVKGE